MAKIGSLKINGDCVHVPADGIDPGENNFAICANCGFFRDREVWFDVPTFLTGYIVVVGVDTKVRLFVKLLHGLREAGLPCPGFSLDDYIEMANQMKNVTSEFRDRN